MKKIDKAVNESAVSEIEKPICGVIMPISANGDYTEQHWIDVRRIISEAIDPLGFDVKIVSDADDSGIIQKRIIQNLYDNDFVVCDVSSKNPNVMFELGLRLAFDKPTIVIKDDKTDYSFDTSPIEHVGYPRDLRYGSIVQFKDKLRSKVEATYALFKKAPAEYSTFLKSFGEYRVPKLDQKVVGKEEFIVGAIEDLASQMRNLRRDLSRDPLSARARMASLAATNFRDDSGTLRRSRSEKIVKNLVKEFVSKTGKGYLDMDDVEDAINYLTTFQNVRDACGGPEVLEELVRAEAVPF